MDSTWPLSAAVVALIVAQATLARNQLGGWLAPGAFFGLCWAVVGVLCLSITPELRVWPGILWVFFMTCTAHLGGLIVSGRPAQSRQTEIDVTTREPPPLPGLVPLLCVSTGLGIAGVLYLVSSTGKPVSALLSLNEIRFLASSFSGARYTDPDYREPSAFSVLSVFVLFAGHLGGILYARTRSLPDKLLALIGVVPAMAETLVTGARTALMAFAICWVASYLGFRAYMGDRQLFNWKRIVAGLAAGLAALTPVYVAVQLVRLDPIVALAMADPKYEQTAISFSIRQARVQYVGHVAAFSLWLEQNWDVWQAPGLGRYSFDGPAGWLGYRVVRNPELIDISPVSDKYKTNVYSMFRQMALDWTIPGSAVFFLLISILAGFADAKMRAGRAAYIAVSVMYYQICLYITGFAMRQTVLIGAWLMFAIYMCAVGSVQASRRAQSWPVD